MRKYVVLISLFFGFLTLQANNEIQLNDKMKVLSKKCYLISIKLV